MKPASTELIPRRHCHHSPVTILPFLQPLLVLTLVLLLPQSWPRCGPGGSLALDFGYHDRNQLQQYLFNVSRRYPSITRLHSIGQSVNGVNLWVIVIGENPRQHVPLRPNVKYVGNIHGNEVVGREILLHLVDHLTSGYGADDNITRLLSSTTVHILPAMNPDGFAASNTSDCSGVKGRYNANKQDLNRNFPDYFIENVAPLQPETRAVMNWIQNTQFVLSANLHGGVLVANYPFDNYKQAAGQPRESLSPDDDVFIHLASVYSYNHPTMRNHAPCFPGDTVFTDGITNGAAWYPLTGGMQDYNYLRGSCYELTLEISCCKYPPASQLQGFWTDNRPPLLKLLQQVHMGVKGLVLDENNNAIAGALVVVGGREAVPFRSSSQGEYFKLLLPGSYTLLVLKSGYNTVSQPFLVTSDQVTRLDVVLTYMTRTETDG